MKNYVCSGRRICKLPKESLPLGKSWCSYCTKSHDLENETFCYHINQEVKPILIKENKQPKLF